MSIPVETEEVVLKAIRVFLHSRADGGAADAMQSLVSITSQLSLSQLGFWEGRIRAVLESRDQSISNPGWKFWKRPTRFLSWLDLCSNNGFERERIVRVVTGGAPNRFFFAILVRRLNDWVPQVRAAARERIVDIAGQTPPEQVVDTLWSVYAHANTWGRMESEDRRVLASLIDAKEVALALKNRILSAIAGPATIIFSQASRSPALDPWMNELAISAVQPAVRAKAYRCLLERRAVWFAGRKWAWTELKWCKGRFEPILEERPLTIDVDVPEQLENASKDASPMVRRVAGELLIRNLKSIGADAVVLARRLAADRHPSVAARGRYALEQLGEPIVSVQTS